jgi:hypothetical protein
VLVTCHVFGCGGWTWLSLTVFGEVGVWGSVSVSFPSFHFNNYEKVRVWGPLFQLPFTSHLSAYPSLSRRIVSVRFTSLEGCMGSHLYNSTPTAHIHIPRTIVPHYLTPSPSKVVCSNTSLRKTTTRLSITCISTTRLCNTRLFYYSSLRRLVFHNTRLF